MHKPPELAAGHEPTVETIELLCDRLADLGLVIGPETARDLVQAILAAEAPRLDARLRDALGTSLETIQIATQSAIGLLSTTAIVTAIAAARESALPPSPPSIERRQPIARRDPVKPDYQELAPAPSPDRREFSESAHRPVFKRPRSR